MHARGNPVTCAPADGPVSVAARGAGERLIMSHSETGVLPVFWQPCNPGQLDKVFGREVEGR